jgi:predicted DNA-binding transcriptional regulator YafY
MNTKDILRIAISEKQVVLLRYDGDGEPMRTVHPHALYMSSKDTLCVECFQVDGYTTLSSLPQWRAFRVESIVAVEALDAHFVTADGWNPDAPKYAQGLIARV